jgi:hypothetical protein
LLLLKYNSNFAPHFSGKIGRLFRQKNCYQAFTKARDIEAGKTLPIEAGGMEFINRRK